jgi:hypothetical protein
MTDEKITTLAEVRAMSPYEIADAQAAGRIDMAAVQADKARESDRAAERGRRIRELLREGVSAPEAVERVDAEAAEQAAKVASAEARAELLRLAFLDAKSGDLPPAA